MSNRCEISPEEKSRAEDLRWLEGHPGKNCDAADPKLYPHPFYLSLIVEPRLMEL